MWGGWGLLRNEFHFGTEARSAAPQVGPVANGTEGTLLGAEASTTVRSRAASHWTGMPTMELKALVLHCAAIAGHQFRAARCR